MRSARRRRAPRVLATTLAATGALIGAAAPLHAAGATDDGQRVRVLVTDGLYSQPGGVPRVAVRFANDHLTPSADQPVTKVPYSVTFSSAGAPDETVTGDVKIVVDESPLGAVTLTGPDKAIRGEVVRLTASWTNTWVVPARVIASQTWGRPLAPVDSTCQDGDALPVDATRSCTVDLRVIDEPGYDHVVVQADITDGRPWVRPGRIYGVHGIHES